MRRYTILLQGTDAVWINLGVYEGRTQQDGLLNCLHKQGDWRVCIEYLGKGIWVYEGQTYRVIPPAGMPDEDVLIV